MPEKEIYFTPKSILNFIENEPHVIDFDAGGSGGFLLEAYNRFIKPFEWKSIIGNPPFGIRGK